MPEMDGWAVLSALKADATLANIPVIMLTITDEKNLGFALGAADYLTKPIDREQLRSVLKKYRSSRQPGVALVVDDDVSVRDRLRRFLENEGWTVTEAENGRLGLERVDESPPNLILLDLMMPTMDGFEFAQQLRRHAQWRRGIVKRMPCSAGDQARWPPLILKVLPGPEPCALKNIPEEQMLTQPCGEGARVITPEGLEPPASAALATFPAGLARNSVSRNNLSLQNLRFCHRHRRHSPHTGPFSLSACQQSNHQAWNGPAD